MSEPDALGPHSLCYSSECGKVLSVLYAGLVDMDSDGELIYRIAESVESEDQVTWTIKLKEDWTFHNGDPVNADAYIRAWNWAAYAPNAADTNGFFSVIEGYDAMNPTEPGVKPTATELSGLKKVDDHTFTVTLNAPFSQFDRSLLYTNAFGAQTQWCLDNTDACNEKPIGTGPYKMVSWEHDQSVVVERWADYPGENAGKADQITFSIYADTGTAFRDWQAGNLDVLNEPKPENVEQARQLAGDRAVEEVESSFYYIGIPQYLDTWTPKQVHALALAINREAIVENLLAGLAEPAASVVPPSIPGGGGDKCEFCTYDPERAKQLMAEAGGLPTKTITLWVNSGAGNEEWVKAIGNGWRETFGLDYTMETPQFSDYLDTMQAHELTGPFRAGWSMDYPSMVNFLKPLYFSGFPSNHTTYSNEQFEQLVEEGNAADGEDAAIEKYTEAERLLLETMPVIPVYFGKAFYVYSDNVESVPYSALHEVPEYESVVVSG
ncbi:MAG TPA: ABC transporter substrate-binding protein [Actinophytocola sp.]|nr:ABC transporter substrate-binding protein [Actinophytocola sp.]